MNNSALIAGVKCQDGSNLADLHLEKGYTVHGIKRRYSLFNTGRMDRLYQYPHEDYPKFILHYGDMTDSLNLTRILQETQPDEIFNLAAKSHVKVCFDTHEYTANADGIGTLRILEVVRLLGLEIRLKFKHLLLNYMAWYKQCLNQKLLLFIQDHLMRLQSFMLIGSLSIIKKPTIFMLVMEYCSIMNHQEVVKHLLPVKLHEHVPK